GQNDVAGSKDDGLGFSSLAYKSADGMDINAESLNLEIDSISYSDPMNLTCNIKQFSTNVALDIPSSGIKSNLKLDNLSANVRMDSTHVDVPYFSLLTPNTNLKGNVEYGFGNDDSGLQADVKGVIGRKDVEQFVNLKELGVSIPQSVGTDVSVTLKNDDLEIRKAEIKLDNSTITAKGNMNLNTMAYNLNADVKNLNVKRYMPELGVGIFDGKIAAKGRGFDIAHDKIDAKLQVRRLQYGGYDLRNITLDGDLSKGLANMTLNIRDAYLDADITLNGNIAQIMKMDMSHPDFRNINGDVTAKVRRADLYHLKVIDHPLTITNVNADASVRNGYLDASIKSRNDMLWGDIDISGMLKTKDFSATIVSDISRLDLKKMGFADDRFITGFCGNIDFYTDMGDNIKVQGLLSDIAIDDSTNYLLPVDAEIDIFSSKDTTYAKIEAASFLLDFKAKSGFSKLADSFTRLIDEIKLQSKNTEIDEPKLKSMYPDCSLYMRMESESPLMLLIDRMGYSFNDIQIDLTSEKDVGLNGYAAAQSLSVDTTMTLDDVLFTITSNNSSTKFSADVQNYPGSKDMVFRAMAEGEIVKNGANIDLKLYDANERLGIRLGAEAMLDKDSLLMRLTPENPILGYKEYHLNPDNFLCLHEKNKITTDIQLVADDGTGLKIYSIPNDEALQDLSLTINRFDLTELTQILPYLPNITGYLEGDMHYVQHPSTTPGQAGKMTVASDIGIRNMTFEQYGLGDISSEFVLLPDLTSGGESALDGTLIKDGTEIASISGRYRSGKNHDDDAYLSAQLDLDHMPMDIVNGFIPDKIIGFMGDADGTLSVEGPMDKLMFNGEIYLDSALLFSEPYGVNLRFDNDPVRIVDSKLLLENFSLYAHDDNPLVIHGNVDFSDMDNMSMDLQMRGQNFEAISAKKSMKSLVYGNAFVDIYAKMNGPMNNLNMSGMVNVLATTNLTYVLDDSPLNTDDQLKGLVTFKDFRDTVTVEEEIRPEISGFNMDLRLNVEDGAQILCNLNKAGTNYVELDGGGDLRMKYNTTENLTLTGKYTLNRGEMKYSLPVIPLRTFTIQKGSYVEFLGDPMNPKLNITATETTHAAVSNYGENRRTVKFNAGVKVTKTLQDMGLQFILEAPEDMTVQNELAEMGETAVGKLAVAMLTSGIYMAESNTSNVSINDALNSYLQGQISNIAGNALKTVDVQMGMTNVADETGASYMDYSFSFAKRFWNNRVSVAVGGRYSTSGNTSHNSGAALDNVSLEYRLNTNASKLLRLNYQRNKLDYIEGYVSEYSGGIMLKKKMNALRELFQFGQKKPQPKR
ncbi:MAG: translocation/assembly module TamB domain-containing protein, partial [Prevotellaceae bacterium]|nr:translocation/assembly module TamB domain-containing protein [Prevotellaceae bacterium]